MTVGAEIVGLAPGAEKNPATARALYDAWLTYGILLFRDIASTARHVDLSLVFGDLEVHPYPEIRCRDDERLVQIGGGNRGPAYVYDGDELLIQRVPWHRDTAYTPAICKGAMLRMVEVAATGGETMLCDTAAAYDDLPADLKGRLAGLEYKGSLRLSMTSQTGPGAFWKTARRATPEEDPEGGIADTDAVAARYPAVVHPVVIEHPESHRKCIFISPTYVDGFIGLSPGESAELLEELCDRMLQPRYIHTHRWRPDDAILWDNRRFLHAARGCPIGERRRAMRTTLAGAMQTGRYFDPAADAAGLPIVND